MKRQAGGDQKSQVVGLCDPNHQTVWRLVSHCRYLAFALSKIESHCWVLSRGRI